MRPNVFRVFWVSGSDTHGKWRQAQRGGRVDLSRQTPSIPLLRGRNGGQTWPRQGQMVTKDGRDGDKRRVRMAEEGTKGTRAGVAGKDG